MTNTKTLSPAAMKVIDGYLHFQMGTAVASVPYFNNKTVGAHFSERTKIGKGDPKDIREELEIFLVKNHIAPTALADESLAKVLADQNLGIDCSGFAYYILDAENRERGLGHLNRRLTFIRGGNPVTKMLSYLRPAQNADVRTFASEANSRVIPLKDVLPGDIVTMIGVGETQDRNHILVVHEVEFTSGLPTALSYSHTMAYPEDGRYATGVKQGRIEITSLGEPLAKQTWIESGSVEKAKRIQDRAIASTTELRRLKWLS